MTKTPFWYWIFSGKSGKDFALDAQEERNAAVRELLLSERGEQDIRRQVSHHVVISLVLQDWIDNSIAKAAPGDLQR